jgi:hypothetical protein
MQRDGHVLDVAATGFDCVRGHRLVEGPVAAAIRVSQITGPACALERSTRQIAVLQRFRGTPASDTIWSRQKKEPTAVTEAVPQDADLSNLLLQGYSPGVDHSNNLRGSGVGDRTLH